LLFSEFDLGGYLYRVSPSSSGKGGGGAHWLAARYGLEAELMDVEEERTVPAPQMIEKMMIYLRPALEENGDWQEVSALVGSTLKHGNGAMRQRQTYEHAGRLQDVVHLLIEETAEGADPT